MGIHARDRGGVSRLEGELRCGLRVASALPAADVAPIGRLIRTGRRLVAMRGVKLYADGSLGSRGATLQADYADRAGHHGTC